MECCCPKGSDLLATAADIGSIFVAIAGFVLAFYIFIYQRGKERLNENLQAFRELILDPNKDKIYLFYRDFAQKAEQLSRAGITDQEKSAIFDDIKETISSFRKDFINLLFIADTKMAQDILRGIDVALDKITRSAFDPAKNLSDKSQFEEQVTMIIQRSRNFLFEKILTYNGANPKRKT